MKRFETLPARPEVARQQTLELQQFLAVHSTLKEQQDLLPFLRQRPHLAAWCGTAKTPVTTPDLLAWEFDLFGDFACDLAVGDSRLKTYSFIEFEDAEPNSLFVQQGKKANRKWSPRVEEGFSQILDWFYKLHDRRNSDEFEQRFGKRSIDFTGILVIGRDQHMDPSERLRWEYRGERVIVDSRRIVCLTYDELAATILARLELVMPLPGKP